MRLPKLLPLILCLSLLGPMSLPAQETSLPISSLTQYRLESGKSYPADLVVHLLDAAIAEGQIAVKNAYNEGYKAGLLDAAPGMAYWQEIAKEYQAAAKPQGPTWGAVILSGFVGLLIGVAGMGLAALVK